MISIYPRPIFIYRNSEGVGKSANGVALYAGPNPVVVTQR